LVKSSSEQTDCTVVSIFVNPMQFNNTEDFEKYPRVLDHDIDMLQSSSCDILFVPSVKEMYDNPLLEVTLIDIGYLDSILEGTRRPGHYQGVVTIVEKLFLAVQPNYVFMGLKDYQQVKVIEHLIQSKNLPITLVGCPTLREDNGLAMSSRNMRLSPEGKQIAGYIFQALQYIQNHFPYQSPTLLCQEAIQHYLRNPPFDLEYLEIRNASDLSEINVHQWEENIDYVVLIALWLEGVRLIDNLEI